jgi:4-amino-4-deoxy-L-arabinose transferase-like glycosyltransferase
MSLVKQLPFFSALLIVCLFLYYSCFNLVGLDSPQYALISKQMLEANSYLQVYENGHDYLDKPPLLFWLTALMFKFFGASEITFRIIPNLSLFITAIFIYKLAKIFYKEEVAIYASFIFLTSFAVMVMALDVRTDTLLTCFATMSIYYLIQFLRLKQNSHFILGFISVGLAMLAKGPIGLMVVGISMVTFLTLSKQLKAIFDFKWLLGGAIVLLVLSPMIIGLYQQFDVHPEKMVNGKHNTSGLKFFFWDQSFGRITGSSSWKNNHDIFFLYHSYLWSVLPWTLFFLVGLFTSIKKRPYVVELTFLITFLIALFILNSSSYLLPHYINVLLPLGSIITAHSFSYLKYTYLKVTKIIVAIVLLLALLLVVGLGYFSFSAVDYALIFPMLLFALSMYLIITASQENSQLFWGQIIGSVSLFFAAGILYFKPLEKFHYNIDLGKWVAQNNHQHNICILANDASFEVNDYALRFYGHIKPKYIKSINEILASPYVVLPTDSLNLLSEQSINFKIINQGDYYPTTIITSKFLNPTTRSQLIKHYTLIEIKKISPP